MIDLGAGEGSVHGQAEDSLVGVLRDWAETGSGSEPLAIKRMEVHRNVMHVHPKPSLPEHREDGRSVPLELLQSEAYDIQMICVLDIGRNSKGSDRKSTRLNSSHRTISYAVFCLKKKKKKKRTLKCLMT